MTSPESSVMRGRRLAANKQRLLDYGIHRVWSMATLCRHRKYGTEFQFSITELAQRAMSTPTCEYCGRRLSWKFGNKITHVDSPTVDNRDMKSRVTLSDISIVCHSCNSCKGARTLAEFVGYLHTHLLAHEDMALLMQTILTHMGEEV